MCACGNAPKFEKTRVISRFLFCFYIFEKFDCEKIPFREKRYFYQLRRYSCIRVIYTYVRSIIKIRDNRDKHLGIVVDRWGVISDLLLLLDVIIFV